MAVHGEDAHMLVPSLAFIVLLAVPTYPVYWLLIVRPRARKHRGRL